ncbi:SMI1/KNR4 family protein [Polyangium sp. y55x31]|uniref:SMI1/KNR4 family protein n=1 Tax=Polyangium sp. y55x31 TaxID=3042688 RepID=UPI002482DA9B|nr:SMI1/KNR4 family protein [Polyangium sp. y55x31]MDI1484137.1 SMI1/KNR4 family protein [Polyangium sp. y55x31]
MKATFDGFSLGGAPPSTIWDGKTMQLVPKDIHRATGHTGGSQQKGNRDMVIKDRGEPLSEQSLQELEEKLGVRLPEPYRRFLQEYNGGRPEPDVLDIAGAPFGGASVRMFFGVGKD